MPILIDGAFERFWEVPEQTGVNLHTAVGERLLQMSVHERLEVQRRGPAGEQHTERLAARLTRAQNAQCLGYIHRQSPAAVSCRELLGK
jgi:hypothetical protein